MRKFEYTLVDVFTNQVFGGNQLAVFKDAEKLSSEEMQSIARELNLSETTFVTDIGPNHKKLRIFTPKTELPMAGHPTIGTAFVLVDEGAVETREGMNKLIFEEGVGEIAVSIHVEGGRIRSIEMEQPMPVFGQVFGDIRTAAELLSLDIADIDTTSPIQTVSTGVPFLYIPLKSLDVISKIKLRLIHGRSSFRQARIRNIYSLLLGKPSMPDQLYTAGCSLRRWALQKIRLQAGQAVRWEHIWLNTVWWHTGMTVNI